MIGFYIAAIGVFAVWLGITTVLLHKAVKRQAVEEGDVGIPGVVVAQPEAVTPSV